MSEHIEDLEEEREFDLELIGNFGRFKSAGSYPVDFLMTTMPLSQARQCLRFARDLEMDEIDFELLMQRDIDEERVERDILPYLQQSVAQAATRPLFFPPLLAAVVPVIDERVENYYGRREIVRPRGGFVGLKWHGDFQLYARETTSADGIPLLLEESSIRIKARQSILALRTAASNPDGVSLVVIDGQHRLLALRRLYDEHRELVRDLIVPVCIMYPPNSEAPNDDRPTVPSVPRVFRALFVDVNSTMKVVGGHFNILLSDKTAGDITCRAFCDYVLENRGREGLACIEWNTRSPKQSNNIVRRHTLTSIGVLQRALFDNIRPDMLLYYLLNITDSAEDLFPEDAGEDEYFSKVKWDSFSYAQSTAIANRAKEHLAPLIERLFFEALPFKLIWREFQDQITQLRAETTSGGRPAIAARAVLRLLLEYKPFVDSEPSFEARLHDVEEHLTAFRDREQLNIVRYALFQRALFNVSDVFFRLGIRASISPSTAYDAFIQLINAIFERDRSVFSPERTYMQFTVFLQRRIRTREDTRTALRDLMLAHLLIPDVRDQVIEQFDDPDNYEFFNTELTDVGFRAAGDFLAKYRDERRRSFLKSYDLDYSLPQEEREQLKLKEMEQRDQEQKVKRGQLDESAVDKSFEREAERYVERYQVEAKDELRAILNLRSGILESNIDEEENDPGED